MYKFLAAALAILLIWGIAQHRKEIRAYEREIANLEYIIDTGEYCLSVCEEIVFD